MTAVTVRNGRRMLSAMGGALLAVAALCVAACENTGGTAAGPGPDGPAMEHPLLPNFPVPVNFQMLPKRSEVRTTAGLRVARCEFEGPTRPDVVVAFYERYMPTAQFDLMDKRFESGVYTLRYQSPEEECSIRVRPEKSKTILAIDLGPLSKSMPERESQPPATGAPAPRAGAAPEVN